MNRNWKAQRERKAFIALEDGSVFRGYSVGSPADAVGEVVFNTGMTGYQEILSDPSYAGQFVVMTSPEIGNTGVNSSDMESSALFAEGLIARDLNCASSWRAEEELSQYLVHNGKPALAGIDTRALTSKIRTRGSMKAYMSVKGTVTEEEAVSKAAAWAGIDGRDYSGNVTCRAPYEWDADGTMTRSWGIADALPPADMKIVAFDFGIKRNILRSLRLCGFRVTVVPARTTAPEALAMEPDGIFFSNGPGDPAALDYAAGTARALFGKLPIMGICLGHQILALAAGASTYRLKFGHHGCNHPVRDLRSGRIEITSQNHNYAVDSDTIKSADFKITHLNMNDGTIEGLAHKTEPVVSVQYHPESCPGPRDSRHLFRVFREMTERV